MSPEVTQAAQIYFAVRIWSAPLALANYTLLGWFVGLARANTALAFQVVINVTNAAMIALLVIHFEMGVAGAALAAVIAEATGAAIGLAMALRILGMRLPDASRVFDVQRIMRMFRVNRDILIRTAALIAAWLFFAAQARGGDVVLAANSVLHNFVLVGAFFLDGFASAAEQQAGAVGARNDLAFSRAVKLSLSWGFGFGIAATIVFLVLGPQLIDLMTSNDAVRQVARHYIVYAALASVIGTLPSPMTGSISARHGRATCGI